MMFKLLHEVAQLYILMKRVSREQELYLEGLFKAEIVKNRPVDAEYDAGCRRYTVFKSKFIYLQNHFGH